MASIPQPVFTQGRNRQPSFIEQLLLRAVNVAPQAFFQFQDLQDRRADRAQTQADRQIQGQVSVAVLGGESREDILRRLGATGGEQVAPQTFTPTTPQTSAPAGAALAGPNAVTLGGGTTALDTSGIDPAVAAVALPLLQQREIFEEQRGAARAERELAQNRDNREERKLTLAAEQQVFDQDMANKMFGERQREVSATVAAAAATRERQLAAGKLDIGALVLQGLNSANEMYEADQARANGFATLLTSFGTPPNQAMEIGQRAFLKGLSREDYVQDLGTALSAAAVDGDYGTAITRWFERFHGTSDPVGAIAEGFGLDGAAVGAIDAAWADSQGDVSKFISRLETQLAINATFTEQKQKDIMQGAIAIAAMRNPGQAEQLRKRLEKSPNTVSRFLQWFAQRATDPRPTIDALGNSLNTFAEVGGVQPSSLQPNR